MSDEIQKLVEERANKAPRVKPQDIEDAIAEEVYLIPAEAIKAFGGQVAANSPLHILTVCTLVLKNGFTVTADAACAAPENFDAEIGRKVARQNAVNKIWPLLGYALRERLNQEQSHG